MDKEKLTALVSRAKAGDPQAMEYLLRYAHTTVSYQCRKFLKNEQDAEDMTQEVLLTVYEKLDRLEQPAAFILWVNRIAATRCINAVNRAHREYQFAEDEDGNSVLDNLEEMDAQRIPDKALDNRETARMIEEIIDSLPAHQRICTYLFYYDQLSVREIARITKTSENTVKSRLNYARKAIKEDVLDYEKQGIKLYSLSPLPFLLYFLRRSAAYNADPVAARAAAQVVTSIGSAAGAGVTGTAENAAASAVKKAAQPEKLQGKYAAAAKNTGRNAASAGGSAAGKAAGAFGGISGKAIAGVLAAVVTVGGIGLAVTGLREDIPEVPIVSTQAYVETEAHNPDLTEAPAAITDTTAPVETTAAIPEEPYTILKTTIDTTGYDCEMFLETPRFAETTEGYKKINAFFEEMRNNYLNGKDENVAYMLERLENQEYVGYGYTQACTVRCQTEHFASVTYGKWWYAGGVMSFTFANYTFDAQTGEILELTDLINGTEQEIADYIVSLYRAEYGGEYPNIPTTYDAFRFYIEDNRVWVCPENLEMVNAPFPYIALPGELS